MKGRDYILVCMKKFQLLQIYLESSFLNKWCQLPCMVSGFVGKVIRICFAKAVPWLNGKIQHLVDVKNLFFFRQFKIMIVARTHQEQTHGKRYDILHVEKFNALNYSSRV